MTFDPDRHHRRSTRLVSHDYASPGAYYVTLCVHGRACLFGDVVDGRMAHGRLGQIVQACWLSLPRHFTRVRLDAFQVMPNHFHGVLILVDEPVRPFDARMDIVRQSGPWPRRLAAEHLSPHGDSPTLQPRGTAHGSLAAIVQSFKKVTSRKTNALNDTHGVRLWQRGYYDRVIRDEEELNRIREYIALNAIRWHEDHEHPLNAGP